MILSKRTIGLLKLFSSINENLYFKTGSKLRTVSQDEGVYAEAVIDEDFPRDFPICGLATFIRNLEAMENAAISLSDKEAVISAQGSDIVYRFGAASLIKSPPDKTLDVSSAEYSLKLTAAQVALVLKLAEINSLPSVSLSNVEGRYYLSAVDRKNRDATVGKIDLGAAPEGEPNWEMAFTFERFSKLTSMDFEVKYVRGKFAAFIGERLTFMIAAEINK